MSSTCCVDLLSVCDDPYAHLEATFDDVEGWDADS
jgi:hypothetical protein